MIVYRLRLPRRVKHGLELSKGKLAVIRFVIIEKMNFLLGHLRLSLVLLFE